MDEAHDVKPFEPARRLDRWERELAQIRPAPLRSKRDELRRRLLALADVVTALLTAIAVLAIGDFRSGLWMSLFVPVWIVVAKINGLYDRDHRTLRHLTVDEMPNIGVWAGASIILVDGLLTFTPPGRLPVGEVLRAMAVAACAGFVLRATARFAWRRIAPRERALIIGSGPFAAAARRKLELFPDIHVEAANVEFDVDDEEEDLELLAEELHYVDRVIVAVSVFDGELVAQMIGTCRRLRLKLSVVPPVRGMFGTAVQLTHLAELPIVEYNTWDVSRSTVLLKRVVDLVLAVVLIVLALPLALAIVIAIKLASPGPVVFRQSRAGQDGKPFCMLKFRTMVSNAEELLPDLIAFSALAEPVFKLRQDPRVTAVGRFLRRTSLDELPQLLNVVTGHMSLVGPRPEQIEVVALYRDEHRFRLSVKPGLTGPMQVNGRGALTFEERLAVEREYIENLSLRRDFRILALTVSSVIGGKGAY